jgi:hypothetical protein
MVTAPRPISPYDARPPKDPRWLSLIWREVECNGKKAFTQVAIARPRF